MRILNEDDDSAMGNVQLFLTMEEAVRLRAVLDAMLSGSMQETAIQDEDYNHEIALAIYREGDHTGLGARARKLISKDR